MRILKLAILFTITLSFSSFAQDANVFPDMETETLTNKFINIPQDLNDKYSVIGLAFSKKSENALKTWFSPAYNQFIHKPETPSLFASEYDVNCYFIPMFTGAKRVAYQKTMDNVKKEIDRRLLPHVLFYSGKLKFYKEALKFDGKDIPYFYVLNPKGEIVYSTSGAYSDAKMQEILEALDEIWGE